MFHLHCLCSPPAVASLTLQACQQWLRPAEETWGVPLLALLPQEGGTDVHQKVKAVLQKTNIREFFSFFLLETCLRL